MDGCDVKGYTAWSLLDNFEWMRGYSERFGLHFVNFSDPERKRIPKASAAYFTSIIEDNGFSRPLHSIYSPDGGTTAKPSEKENSCIIGHIQHNDKTSASDVLKLHIVTFKVLLIVHVIHLIYSAGD